MITQKVRAKEMAEAEKRRLENAKKEFEATNKRRVFSDGIRDTQKIDKVPFRLHHIHVYD